MKPKHHLFLGDDEAEWEHRESPTHSGECLNKSIIAVAAPQHIRTQSLRQKSVASFTKRCGREGLVVTV